MSSVGLLDDVREFVSKILDLISLGEMTRIGPFDVVVTVVPQPVIPAGWQHLRKAQSIYIVLTDLGTLTAADQVYVGDYSAQLQPLYGLGDTYFEENQFMRYTDASGLWVRTNAHSATVTVSGVAYKSLLMGGEG